MAADRSSERAAMLEHQLAARGITDQRVLAAMGAVPREAFVPPERAHEAYGDHAVSLAAGQTISQPWIVAAICQALELSCRRPRARDRHRQRLLDGRDLAARRRGDLDRAPARARRARPPQPRGRRRARGRGDLRRRQRRPARAGAVRRDRRPRRDPDRAAAPARPARARAAASSPRSPSRPGPGASPGEYLVRWVRPREELGEQALESGRRAAATCARRSPPAASCR